MKSQYDTDSRFASNVYMKTNKRLICIVTWIHLLKHLYTWSINSSLFLSLLPPFMFNFHYLFFFLLLLFFLLSIYFCTFSPRPSFSFTFLLILFLLCHPLLSQLLLLYSFSFVPFPSLLIVLLISHLLISHLLLLYSLSFIPFPSHSNKKKKLIKKIKKTSQDEEKSQSQNK